MASGEIYHEQAYAQGKMIESANWGRMTRGITPSDVDLVWDNRGYILFCEFTRREFPHSSMKKGQFLLYQALVKNCPDKHVFALCKHNAPLDRKICSKRDVKQFELMTYKNGHEEWKTFEGDMWPVAVELWLTEPHGVFRLFGS